MTEIPIEDKAKLDVSIPETNKQVNTDPRSNDPVFDNRMLVDWEWFRTCTGPRPEGKEALRIVPAEEAVLATSVWAGGYFENVKEYIPVVLTDSGMFLDWVKYNPDDHMHMPCFDLDFKFGSIKTLASASGNTHLYINVPMPWAKVLTLLDAFQAAGLLEAGYVKACKEQGMTRLRMPGIHKPPTKWASSENL